jgi:bifunctional non-homologous end joining protein LigD
LTYVLFDLLCYDDADLRGQPIEARRAMLRQVVGEAKPPFALATAQAGPADQLLLAACRAGFEGLVGKRVGSSYRPGRSLDWIKLKCELRQELAVVGYLPLTGSQHGVVGSLLLALHKDGRLIYAGKVGTGFDMKTRRQLGKMLEERHTGEPPVSSLPRSGGLARYATPGLVVEVKLSQWTRDGHARHPSYLGLRPDKRPEDCVREGGRRA